LEEAEREFTSIRKENERLKTKILSDKTFLAMVVHELKHPIEALASQHGMLEEQVKKISKRVEELSALLYELVELDAEDLPAMSLRNRSMNPTNLLQK
jgi:benzoyl-CoA reductase/2-hydroxyglutaryl-CoA dehydratase subunit BcrC/BadD/HgdB